MPFLSDVRSVAGRTLRDVRDRVHARAIRWHEVDGLRLLGGNWMAAGGDHEAVELGLFREALDSIDAVVAILAVGVPILYGKEFHETIPLGLILLPGVLLLGIGKILASAISGRGYPRYTLYVGAFSVPLTLALYFTLIPAFGTYGAAVASSISYGFTALGNWVYFRRVVPLGVRESFVPTFLDVADYREAARLARDRFTRGRSSPQ